VQDLVHLFSKEVVSEFLDCAGKKFDFEFVCALMMHRVYEDQWRAPTMIGFYLTQKYADLLKGNENPERKLLMDALAHGIKEDHPVDFVLASEAANSLAEFQLKRFGMVGQENSTDGLVAYLNKMNGRYAPSDATCLVAIGDIEAIDFPRVGDEVEKEAFPFAELLLVGVAADKFIIAGIKPHKGWGVAYDLQLVVR
jgi:hypothetical protein